MRSMRSKCNKCPHVMGTLFRGTGVGGLGPVQRVVGWHRGGAGAAPHCEQNDRQELETLPSSNFVGR